MFGARVSHESFSGEFAAGIFAYGTRLIGFGVWYAPAGVLSEDIIGTEVDEWYIQRGTRGGQVLGTLCIHCGCPVAFLFGPIDEVVRGRIDDKVWPRSRKYVSDAGGVGNVERITTEGHKLSWQTRRKGGS